MFVICCQNAVSGSRIWRDVSATRPAEEPDGHFCKFHQAGRHLLFCAARVRLFRPVAAERAGQNAQVDERVTLIGHSWGASLALLYAAEHSEQTIIRNDISAYRSECRIPLPLKTHHKIGRS